MVPRLSRHVRYSSLLLIALNAEWGTLRALSPMTTTRNIIAVGSSSFPLLHLSLKNHVDEDGAGNCSGDTAMDSNKCASDFDAKTSKISQPTKSDFYGDDELTSLLEMHQYLQSAMISQETSTEPTKQVRESPNDIFSGGLHDFILQSIDEIEREEIEEDQTWISDDIKGKMSKLNITAVASDVDGTIIGFDQKIHPRTRDAIKAALESSELEWIFPATGKTRWGARNSLGSELSSLTEGPGVYVQGLYCLGNNNEVIFEKKLTSAAVDAAEELVANLKVAVVAYDGDSLYTSDLDREEVVELHEKWGEPASREISSLSEHSPGVHKMLLMDHNIEKLREEVRPKLEELAKEYNCVVTQAVPTMLELLPFGCSKAMGVQIICKYLGVDPASELLTIGDAENDVEMLEVSAIGVAVGNACSAAKNASDIVLPLRCGEGAVGMALKDILSV